MVTWLDRRMNKPCIVYTRVESGKDEYGNILYADVENPTVCFIQPVSQEESADGRVDVAHFQIHLPASVVGILDGFSRLEVDGVSYEASEPPAVYPSLTGPGVHHVEVIVRRGTA